MRTPVRVIYSVACIIGFMLLLLSGRFRLAFPAACTIALAANTTLFAQRGTLFRQQVERQSKEAQDFIAFGGWFLIAVLAAAVAALWVIALFYPQYVQGQ